MESKARVFPPTPKPKQGRTLAKARAININRMAFARGHLENVRGFIMNKKQLRDEVEEEEEPKALGRILEAPLLRTPLAVERKVGNHLRPEAKVGNHLHPDAGRAPLVIKISQLVAFFFKAIALRCKLACFSIHRLANFINKASAG